MTSDEAERIAAKKLPCYAELPFTHDDYAADCGTKGRIHWRDCPSLRRPAVASAILDAYAEGERASAASHKRLVEALRPFTRIPNWYPGDDGALEWLGASDGLCPSRLIERATTLLATYDALAAEAQEGEPKP